MITSNTMQQKKNLKRGQELMRRELACVLKHSVIGVPTEYQVPRIFTRIPALASPEKLQQTRLSLLTHEQCEVVFNVSVSRYLLCRNTPTRAIVLWVRRPASYIRRIENLLQTVTNNYNTTALIEMIHFWPLYRCLRKTNRLSRRTWTFSLTSITRHLCNKCG